MSERKAELANLNSLIYPLARIDEEELRTAVGAARSAANLYSIDPALMAAISILNTTIRGVERSQGYSLNEALKFAEALDLTRAEVARQDAGEMPK